MIRIAGVLLTVLLLSSTSIRAQVPVITESNGRHKLLVDGKPFFILGGQLHNSSAWPAMMPYVWQSADYMHLNTLEVPVYWEQVEPKEDSFDFSIVDALLAQAKTHGVHLILLWFGTWKNGSDHYMPGWMKRDIEKYPNIIGENGKPVDSPSPYSEFTLQADEKAFVAIMHHLKENDPDHTVIMVQVENEPGTWGSMRDYSPRAEKLFSEDVPAALLKPDILKALNVRIVSKGTWRQVFGERADEYFHAWSIARYINEVAEAGKAEYPLPMYVNAALRDPLSNPFATQYESGGATDNVIPIWKAAAPSIDLLAPDIYLQGNERILKVLDLYDRPDNTLFVPEIGLSKVNAKYLYAVLAHGGIGFSPFGIDNNGDTLIEEKLKEKLSFYADEYKLLSSIPQLADLGVEGQISAAVEDKSHSPKTLRLGSWQATVTFGRNRRQNNTDVNVELTGKVMFIQLDDVTFLATGTDAHITFSPLGTNAGRPWQYLKVEEGYFENGIFKVIRNLNGDETDWGGPGFSSHAVLLRISLVVR
jgi:Domain of unknown function (DUF5597)/Beta-galactosidase